VARTLAGCTAHLFRHSGPRPFEARFARFKGFIEKPVTMLV
jgi:hypothetical protein